MTIPQCTTRIKMDYAGKALQVTFWQVTEIAHYLGYDDPSYFVRLFKRIKGETPLEYRRKVASVQKQTPESINSQPVP